jgi:hypothetical protein
LTQDIAKDCNMKYLERLSVYVPDLAGDIVKDCYMKYHDRIFLYIPDLIEVLSKIAT